MHKGQIITTLEMQRNIALSFQRSEALGIDPIKRNPHQEMLSPADLAKRRRDNAELLDVLLPQLKEFYNLLSPNDFFIAATDAEGYVLHIKGSPQVIEQSAERNCVPGYRWTEADVGTSAIALCLKLKNPIQLIKDEHYCRQAHGLTSSAAPIFGKDNTLVGVLAVSGAWEKAHPHTLYMITTAARAVEQQLRVLRRNRELESNLNFLDQVISSSKNGLMIVNSDMQIWRANRQCRRILRRQDLEGCHLSVLKGLDVDLDHVQDHPEAWSHKEARLRINNQTVSIIYTVQPVVSGEGERLGAVLFFDEVREVYKMAHTIAGTRAHYTFDSLAGASPGFLKAVKLARRTAASDSTVLIQGETGTGKELFAQAIHNLSDRHANPFIPINCGAIPSNLLESELFGYVAGTFTGASKAGKPGKFELAHTGTLFLDEIGDMPHRMQVKLLRVLQTGEVYRIGADKPVKIDTRIVAATHVNLEQAIREGRFREDLFYRLNVFPIAIPPLRDRGREDILTLARLFLGDTAASPPELGKEVEEILARHHWPGNVRELENCMQRAVHLCDGKTLGPEHLGFTQTRIHRAFQSGTLEEMTRKMIQEALERTGHNMALTAKILGISRATLYRKVAKFDQGPAQA